MMLALLWLTLCASTARATISNFTSCDGCWSRGYLVYGGSYECTCGCDAINGTTVKYLTPHCRYTPSQSVQFAITIARAPGTFYFSDYITLMRTNLDIPDTARVVVSRAENLTLSTKFYVYIQDDGPDRNSLPSVKYWSDLLLLQSKSSEPWLVDALIASVERLAQEEASVPSYPIVGDVMPGLSLPSEPCIVFGAAVFIAFVMYAQEIILTSNYVVGDGEELLEALRLKRRKDKEIKYVPAPVAPPKPKEAWLSDEAPAPIVLEDKSKRAKGTRSFAEYADSFFSNA